MPRGSAPRRSPRAARHSVTTCSARRSDAVTVPRFEIALVRVAATARPTTSGTWVPPGPSKCAAPSARAGKWARTEATSYGIPASSPIPPQPGWGGGSADGMPGRSPGSGHRAALGEACGALDADRRALVELLQGARAGIRAAAPQARDDLVEHVLDARTRRVDVHACRADALLEHRLASPVVCRV